MNFIFLVNPNQVAFPPMQQAFQHGKRKMVKWFVNHKKAHGVEWKTHFPRTLYQGLLYKIRNFVIHF